MQKVQSFLLFASGANNSILKKCPSDVNRYTAIGATVFFTGLMAFVSASYALNSVFDSIPIAAFFGLIWGIMIFNLDRFIVLSLRSTGSFIKDVWVAIPRVLLALLFAVVISTPLELRIFQNEIEGELITMNQEQRKSQEALVRSRFSDKREQLLATRTKISSEVTDLRIKRDELALIALQEADGTGGSLKQNLGPIYKAKKAEADRVNLELEQKIADSKPLMDQLETGLKANYYEELAAVEGLKTVPTNGLIGRLNALSRITKTSSMVYTAHLFIFLLFVALELAPILVKMISLRSPYDLVLAEHELAYETSNKVKTHLARATMNEKIEVNTAKIGHRTIATIEAEKAIIDQKLNEHLRKIKEGSKDWDNAFG